MTDTAHPAVPQPPSGAPIALEIDLDSLTVQDIDAIEIITGLSFLDITDAVNGRPGPDGRRWPMGRVLLALAFVQHRKTDPTVTLDTMPPVEMPAPDPEEVAQEGNPPTLPPPASDNPRSSATA